MNCNRIAAIVIASACLFAAGSTPNSGVTARNPRISDNQRAVLTRARLNPPVRSGNRHVRFSPNGEYILVQDDSGVRVFSRDPATEKFYMPATRILTASFSADSKDLVIAGINLQVAVASVTGGHQDEMKSLSSGINRCELARLSPTGNALACLDDKAKLHVLQIPDGRELIGFQVNNVPVRDHEFSAACCFLGILAAIRVPNDKLAAFLGEWERP